MKKVIKSVVFIILCLCLIFSIFKLLLDNKKELYINEKNKNELIEMLAEEYEYPDQITSLKLDVMLGDGELYLYKGLKLEKKTLIGENSKIFQYVIEKGSNSGGKYIIVIIISLVGMLFCKTDIITKKSEE